MTDHLTDLTDSLNRHLLWLVGEEGGERLALTGADRSGCTGPGVIRWYSAIAADGDRDSVRLAAGRVGR